MRPAVEWLLVGRAVSKRWCNINEALLPTLHYTPVAVLELRLLLLLSPRLVTCLELVYPIARVSDCTCEEAHHTVLYVFSQLHQYAYVKNDVFTCNVICLKLLGLCSVTPACRVACRVVRPAPQVAPILQPRSSCQQCNWLGIHTGHAWKGRGWAPGVMEPRARNSAKPYGVKMGG